MHSKSQATQHFSARIVHPFAPFYDKNSAVLIVGSFPSVASRADGFYYGNVRNRFWKVLAAVFEEDCRVKPDNDTNGKNYNDTKSMFDNDSTTAMTIPEKKVFLACHKIALYDSIRECTILGSSDSSIRDVVPSDIESIVKNSKVKKIFANGKTAARFFEKYQSEKLCKMLEVLPSTSPANASFSLARLVEEWKVVAE